MAKSEGKTTRRSIVGLIASYWDAIFSVGKALAATSFGAAVIGWLTDVYGLFSAKPGAWVYGSLVGALVFGVLYALIPLGLRQWMIYKAQKKLLSAPDRINAAAPEFRDQRVNMADLIIPGAPRVVRNRKFINCQIIGPANLLFWRGASFGRSQWQNCDAVVLKPAAVINNAVWLDNIEFVGECYFTGVTLLLSPDQYQCYKNMKFNWITRPPATTLGANAQQLEPPSGGT